MDPLDFVKNLTLVSTLTGGGDFSFFNQPIAAEANYYCFGKQ